MPISDDNTDDIETADDLTPEQLGVTLPEQIAPDQTPEQEAEYEKEAEQVENQIRKNDNE